MLFGTNDNLLFVRRAVVLVTDIAFIDADVVVLLTLMMHDSQNKSGARLCLKL